MDYNNIIMSATITAQSVQVKLTLPTQLQQFVKSKADKFGMTLSGYIKYLVLDDVRDVDIPTFKMSKKTEENGLKALEEYRLGKTHEMHDVDEFFDSL